ncbi:galactose oxidase-like domain-containing protein [Hyalangium sp.]|uniref:galactose oxidase-like domain-containing protein n=1 Tax=Hyalangium sp. TaxID=2028555 RepID=UPI002D5BD873|nr:galactose oxidase-like domain-containing protein [Hyalangium sp.]HYI03179.1 galactose oxidase-like domain-containing protein [Hyalangium sp.]
MAWPLSATHTSLQPDGKVMFFGEFDEGDDPPRRWDPVTNTLSALPTAGYNIFCAGHSYLADGRLLVTGGHIASHVGLNDASLFDPFTGTWSRLPDMNAGRWYPTNVTLPNGDVMVLSGEINGVSDINEIPQRYLAASRTWRTMTSARLDMPYYPRMFLAPNGRLFFAAPWRATRFMDPNGTGSWSSGPSSLFGGRSYGPAVMLDGTVVIIGGGDPPTATVELIDLNVASPTWRYVASMSVRRRQHNATLLPDGTVLVTGGSSGSGFDNAGARVFHAEVWNPVTNRWTRLASNSIYRGYHATALLLPDGRVLSAGGRHARSAEIFSPPYLFKGARPTVSSAPGVVTPGTTFTVGTPEAARIVKVTLIALGSVTHSFDQNQRLITLGFTRGTGSLTITAPPGNTVAPPGYYQLFLVNDLGVPSHGSMVRVSTVAGALQEP